MGEGSLPRSIRPVLLSVVLSLDERDRSLSRRTPAVRGCIHFAQKYPPLSSRDLRRRYHGSAGAPTLRITDDGPSLKAGDRSRLQAESWGRSPSVGGRKRLRGRRGRRRTAALCLGGAGRGAGGRARAPSDGPLRSPLSTRSAGARARASSLLHLRSGLARKALQPLVSKQ